MFSWFSGPSPFWIPAFAGISGLEIVLPSHAAQLRSGADLPHVLCVVGATLRVCVVGGCSSPMFSSSGSSSRGKGCFRGSMIGAEFGRTTSPAPTGIAMQGSFYLFVQPLDARSVDSRAIPLNPFSRRALATLTAPGLITSTQETARSRRICTSFEHFTVTRGICASSGPSSLPVNPQRMRYPNEYPGTLQSFQHASLVSARGFAYHDTDSASRQPRASVASPSPPIRRIQMLFAHVYPRCHFHPYLPPLPMPSTLAIRVVYP